MKRIGKFMRKAVAASVLASLFLTSCGKGQTDSVSVIQERGSFQVAFVGYSQMDGSSQAQTAEENLAVRIGDALGTETTFIHSDNQDDALAKVISGEVDMAIGSITASAAMEESVDYSVPYRSEGLYVVTARGDYSDSPAAFSGRTLGTLPAFSQQTESLGAVADNLTVRIYQTAQEGGSAILSGEADGLVIGYEDGLALLAQHEGMLQMQNMQNVDAQEFVTAVREGDSRLLQGINTLISRMADDAAGVENPAESGT